MEPTVRPSAVEEQSVRLDPTADQRRGYRAADDSEHAQLQVNRYRTAQQVAHDCGLLAQEVAALRRVRDQVHRAEGVVEHPATLVQRRRVQQSVTDAVDTLALVSGEVSDLVPTAPVADSLAALLPHPQESTARPDAGTVQAPPAPAGAPGTSPVTSGEPDASAADPSAALLAQLDELGVPPDASRAQHRARLTQAGVRVGTTDWPRRFAPAGSAQTPPVSRGRRSNTEWVRVVRYRHSGLPTRTR